MKTITAIVKSAEEITGIKNCVEFKGSNFYYDRGMNHLAGQRLALTTFVSSGYDFTGSGWAWKKEWLKDIQEEKVDWSKIPIDTKVEIRINGVWLRRYFAGMFPTGVRIFSFGQTSWSSMGEEPYSPREIRLYDENS